MTLLALSRIHYPVSTLGPGQRLGIWFQGCSIRCPGCISRDTWQTDTVHELQVTDLLTRIAPWAEKADGLTISGGEPLDQPDALRALLLGWRAMSQRSVLLFTGYDFGAASPWLTRNPGLVDGVVAGPYDASAGDRLALRGSDNQTLHVLTSRGAEFAGYERPSQAQERRLDVMIDEAGNAWLVGIPEHGLMRKLRDSLGARGHRAVTSDQAGILA